MEAKKNKGRIKKFFTEFKEFISKGNILDLAVGVIIGGAFGKIVTSLVNDIIMPLISLAVGGKSVEDWKIIITPATEEVAESAIRFGLFIQSIIDFLIIAFFIFLAIRFVMKIRLRSKAEDEEYLSKKERKVLLKEFIRQGNSNLEANELVKAKIEELKAQREVVEEQPAIEETDDILKDIRELLKASTAKHG